VIVELRSPATTISCNNHAAAKRGLELKHQGDRAMRFMVIVKATKNSEAGIMPSQQLLTDMGNYNEELVKAGVMQAGEGLHPSSKVARVKFSGDKRVVTDGPFAETKELVAGFWLEAEDFGPEFTPELREQEERLLKQATQNR
jgi:hypothetical protein